MAHLAFPLQNPQFPTPKTHQAAVWVGQPAAWTVRRTRNRVAAPAPPPPRSCGARAARSARPEPQEPASPTAPVLCSEVRLSDLDLISSSRGNQNSNPFCLCYVLSNPEVNFLCCSSKYFLVMGIPYSKILGPSLCGHIHFSSRRLQFVLLSYSYSYNSTRRLDLGSKKKGEA